jgi:hypothetical protein
MAYKDPLDPRNRAARRKHYHANKEQYFQRNAVKRREMRNWIAQLKSQPCMDCHQQYTPYVMDLDHRDPSIKVGNINQLVARGSWSKLEAEVAKCDIVCANCHRERTYNRAGECRAPDSLQNC